MNDRLHLISDCLAEDWIGAWATEGLLEVEELLGKHAAFESFLDGDQQAIAD
ncbi:MAG: hypothetical protein H0U90_04110 [Actinobacteria bacterium]|nr:hypothetical protein [Actinomycetota bacterium]